MSNRQARIQQRLKRIPVTRLTIGGILAVLLVELASIALGAFFDPVPAFILFLIGAFVSVLIVNRRSSGSSHLVVLAAGLAFVAVFISLTNLPTVAGNWFGERTPPISVTDAPRQPAATIFFFTDGMPLRQYMGEYRGPSVPRGGSFPFYVVPIVGPSWQPSDPVPAWAGCHIIPCYGRWDTPARAGYRVAEPAERDKAARAVRDAEQRHKLTSAPGAPVLYWTEKPLEELTRQATFSFVSIGCSLSIWLVILPVIWLLHRKDIPR